MVIALWIVQILLAIMFGMAGMMKITQSKEKLAERMEWVEDFSVGAIRGIGILEGLAAIGLILPVLTGVLPILTALAALGLVLTMIGAMITHLRRGESRMIATNVLLLILAGFVAYGRFFLV